MDNVVNAQGINRTYTFSRNGNNSSINIIVDTIFVWVLDHACIHASHNEAKSTRVYARALSFAH
eukprot:m.255694 g.255694  ORF g.255694 m.255694 type:complete len:64 (-) comp15504_c0_seq1:158-349(-)